MTDNPYQPPQTDPASNFRDTTTIAEPERRIEEQENALTVRGSSRIVLPIAGIAWILENVGVLPLRRQRFRRSTTYGALCGSHSET